MRLVERLVSVVSSKKRKRAKASSEPSHNDKVQVQDLAQEVKDTPEATTSSKVTSKTFELGDKQEVQVVSDEKKCHHSSFVSVVSSCCRKPVPVKTVKFVETEVPTPKLKSYLRSLRFNKIKSEDVSLRSGKPSNKVLRFFSKKKESAPFEPIHREIVEDVVVDRDLNSTLTCTVEVHDDEENKVISWVLQDGAETFTIGGTGRNKILQGKMGIDYDKRGKNLPVFGTTAEVHAKVYNKNELDVYDDSAKLTPQNINSVNGNQLIGSNTLESVNQTELLREKLRQERNRFFSNLGATVTDSTSEVPPVLVDMRSLRTSGNLNSNNNNRRLGPVSQSPNRSSPQWRASNTENTVKDGMMPKLFSVRSDNEDDRGSISSGTSHKSRTAPGSSSKLPLFVNSSNSSNTAAKASLRQGVSPGRGKLQPYALRTVAKTRSKDSDSEWVSGNDFFTTSRPQSTSSSVGPARPDRRETLPTNLQSVGDNKNAINVVNRRSSGSVLVGSRLPTYGGSSQAMKKPNASEPFYMLGMYQNGQNGQAGQRYSKPLGRSSVPGRQFPQVSTGNVKEKARQFQPETPAEKETAGLNRSATFTKYKHIIPSALEGSSSSQRTQGPSDGGGGDYSLNASGYMSSGTFRIRKTATRRSTSEFGQGSSNRTSVLSDNSIEGNYAITRDGSTASSSTDEQFGSGGRSATAEPDKVCSDSEFLIDDEISDQPELTLTFKDSPLILSPSSSGESLISCDLMLDYKDGENSGRVSSDSTLLEEEPSVIVTSSRKEDKRGVSVSSVIARKDQVATQSHQESKNQLNSQIPRTMVNASPNKVLAPTAIESAAGNKETTSPVISSSNKASPKKPIGGNNISAAVQNLVDTNNTVNAYGTSPNTQQRSPVISQQMHQNSVTARSLRSPFASPQRVGEAVQLHSTPKRLFTENRNYPPPVRTPSLTKSPSRIATRANASHIPRSPSPIIPVPMSRCFRPKSQEILFSPAKSVESLNKESAKENDVMEDLMSDVLDEVKEYQTALEQLKVILVTKENEEAEKDDIIHRQQAEITFWKSKVQELEKELKKGEVIDLAYNDGATEV